MSQTLIVYCHPYEKSYNHAILERITKTLSSNGTKYELIDLYADRFNPVYTAEELALYESGQTQDPLVTLYLAALKRANQLIIITPIWWNDLPAMLKGFFDKVMKKGTEQAYISTQHGVQGNLTNITSTLILTTSASPTFYLKTFGGNAIKKVWVKATMKQLGIKNVKWRNFGNISHSSAEDRGKFLQQTDFLVASTYYR